MKRKPAHGAEPSRQGRAPAARPRSRSARLPVATAPPAWTCWPPLPNGAPLRLAPGARALVPTGLVLELPPGFEAQVRPRSGLALRHGITVLNSPGTIDSDYRGEVRCCSSTSAKQAVRDRARRAHRPARRAARRARELVEVAEIADARAAPAASARPAARLERADKRKRRCAAESRSVKSER